MKGKRTGLDFSKHEVIITQKEGLLIHWLKKPDTIAHNIKFINTNDVLVVTGDFDNWVFDREFWPSADGGVSDGYWLEKLSGEGVVYSSEETKKTLEHEIKEGLENYGYKGERLDEMKEFYTELLDYTDEKWQYISKAHGYDKPDFLEHSDVPYEKVTKPYLECIFDGFDEICRRMKEGLIKEAKS